MPLAVQDDLQDIKTTYGCLENPLYASDFLPGTKIAHPMRMPIYIKTYNTELQRETIQTSYKLSRENSGRLHVLFFCQREDMKTASPGIYASSNGKFADNDGRLGIIYKEYHSVDNAHEKKAILP
jgi:hypothetical protein